MSDALVSRFDDAAADHARRRATETSFRLQVAAARSFLPESPGRVLDLGCGSGIMPLVLATGAGAVSRNNIGLVVSVGLSVGTLFTLFVIPVMYSLMAKQHSEVAEVDLMVNEVS